MAHEQNKPLDDVELDRLFADVRGAAPLPPSDLLARIEADALRLQAAPSRRPVARAPARGGWRWLRDRLAWGALPAGLVAAGMAGLWIGLAAGGAGTYAFSVYDSDVGLQLVYEFPALAGLMPEG